MKRYFLLIFIIGIMVSCKQDTEKWQTKVYETSAAGNKMTEVTDFTIKENTVEIIINPEKRYQTITGIGGSFTESSAHLLNQMSILAMKVLNIH